MNQNLLGGSRLRGRFVQAAWGRRFKTALAFLVLASVRDTLVSAQDSDLTSLLEAMRNAAQYRGPISFDSHLEGFNVVKGGERPEKPNFEYWATFHRNDFDTVERSAETLHSNGKRSSSRSLWKDGTSYVNTLQRAGGKEFAMYHTSRTDVRGRQIHASRVSGAFLEGRFPHYWQPDWLQLLAESGTVTLDAESSLVDGSPCVVIRADTSYGSYTLWVDPNAGYNIRAAKVVVPSIDFTDFSRRSGGPKRTDYELKDVVIEEIDGVFVATAGTFVESYTRLSDNPEFPDADVIYRVKRTNVEVNPDFEAMGAFEVNWPEGARVFDDAGNQFEWRSGKLVPLV